MNSLRVLDVTLRDGGCVNDFDFGQAYMESILTALESSHIDVIELGYLDDKRGSLFGRTQYINELVIPECILKHKIPDIEYVAMMDYGKFDVEHLNYRSSNGIDGIRLAFHKKNCLDMIPLARNIINKGYNLYLQPMITLRYSDSELLDLLSIINDELADAAGFYIVDSFGEMRPNDIARIFNLVDHNLIASMPLGFHSHNNLQLSYSNAMSILQFPTTRDLLIDCSIMGMGKGAGNLNTELLIEHLNLFHNKDYSIAPLLQVIDKVINQLHHEFYWGYAPEYYLSSINHCTPSYASYFYNRHMLPINQVSELLSLIAEDKKISFDRNYAEKLYRIYNESNTVDDSAVLEELKTEFKDKTLLLVAPGKSILSYMDIIKDTAAKEGITSMGLNVDLGFDYILTTRADVYSKAVEDGKQLIVPSNVSKELRSNAKVLDYVKWIEVDDRTHDSSAVIALKLAQSCNVDSIILAGFDGFSTSINDNYFDPNLRNPVNEEQAERRNKYYKDLIERVRNTGIDVSFITPSKYQ